MKLGSIRSKPFRFRGNNFTGGFSIVEIHGCVTRIHSRRDSKYFHDATYRITKALIPDFDRVLTVASRITATPMAEPPIGNASHSSALSLAEICPCLLEIWTSTIHLCLPTLDGSESLANFPREHTLNLIRSIRLINWRRNFVSDQTYKSTIDFQHYPFNWMWYRNILRLLLILLI